MPKFSYILINLNVPTTYKCSVCGGTQCKLWREYNCFSPKLFCAECAAKKEKKSIKSMNKEGKYFSGGRLRMWTDQIGWYVPAVPLEDDSGYWGYTSVPENGCLWWRSLPNLPKK